MLFFQYQIRKTQIIINLTTEQKLSDFDVLCELLDDSYPFWNEINQAGINKEDIYTEYRTAIANTKTDIEFFKNISYFLNEFKKFGHLSVVDGYMYRVYVDTIINSNNMLSEQEKQNIKPLHEVLDNPITQNTYSLLDQSHPGFRSIIGLKEEYKNQNTENEAQSSRILTSIYDDREAAYIKIENFGLSKYQEDKLTLEKFFLQIKDIPNLIIDLRGNRGGSDLYWKDLIVESNAKEDLMSQRYFL